MARGFYLEVCSQDGSIIPYKIVITDYEDLSKEEQATNAEKTGSIDVSAIEKQYGIPQSPDEEHLREKEQEERREKAAARTKKIIEDGYTVFACQRMDFNPRNGTKGTFKSSMQNANHYDLKRFDHYLPIWDPDNTQDMVFLYRISDGEFFPSASKATCCRSSNLTSNRTSGPDRLHILNKKGWGPSLLHIYKESLAKSGKSAPPKRKARKQKKNKEETEEPHEEAGTREEYEIQDEEEELLDVPSTPALFSNNTEQIQANQEIISINDKLFFVLEKRNLVPQDDEDYEAMMLKLKEWSEALYFKGIYTRHLDEGNFSSADLKQLSCNFKEELFGILKEFEDANIIEGLVSGIASFYIRCGGPFIKSSLLPKEKGINYVLASFE